MSLSRTNSPNIAIFRIDFIFSHLSAYLPKSANQGSPDSSTSVLCVPRTRRYAYHKIRDLLFKYFKRKLGIEHMNKESGKIEILYLLVDVLNAFWKKLLAHFTITTLV